MPVLFCQIFHADNRSPLQSRKPGLRKFVTCKGSHSTAGPEPSSDWLPDPGRDKDVVYITQLGRREGMTFLPLDRWGNGGPV